MGGSKIGLRLFFVLSLSAGCPLEDDPVEDGRSNANPAEGGGSGTQDNGGSDDNGSGTGDDNGSSGNGSSGNGSDGNSGDSELDAGSTGAVDAGSNGGADSSATGSSVDASSTSGGLDASTTGGGEDASSTGGGEDASATSGGEDASEPVPDAGPSDAGESEPDSQVEEDAGPPIVVPDLGAAAMPDAERVTLIVNYLATEGYIDNWYPELQGQAVERPLIVSPSHGTSVRPFQNAVSRQALDAWVAQGLPLPLDMPNGSVIIKESYKVDAMTQQVVPNGKLVMAKIDALDPATYEGNWFFLRITAAGVAARATTCVDCHNGRKATGAWPISETNPTGGKPNALVPYDYMFVPYCYDPSTPECIGPN